MVSLALRASLASVASRDNFFEGERRARRAEQVRLSGELHDTLKQSVYGLSMLLDSYREAREERADPERARELLGRAVEVSRDARHYVGKPVEELRALSTEVPPEPEKLLGELLYDVERYFEVRTHKSFKESLEDLSQVQLAAAYRVAAEALWNAGKHSGAQNVWLESRRAGGIVIVRVQDDGCGFSKQRARKGSGQVLMHERARESGGKLDLISKPGVGTTVQLRFETRG